MIISDKREIFRSQNIQFFHSYPRINVIYQIKYLIAYADYLWILIMGVSDKY